MNRLSRDRSSQYVKRAAIIASVVAIGACGSDPKTAGPGFDQVSGQWSYTAMAGSCSISGARMSLTQSGTTVTGSVSGGILNTTIDSVLTGPFPIANGTVRAFGALFDVSLPGIFAGAGSISVHNVGTVNGNAISGTVTLTNVLGNGLVFTGNFAAVRQ